MYCVKTLDKAEDEKHNLINERYFITWPCCLMYNYMAVATVQIGLHPDGKKGKFG